MPIPSSSLSLPPLIWPAEDLWLALEAQLPGLTVEVLPELDSTNTELMRRARAGQTEPVLLVAERQTAGRGRLGRPWHGEAGQALTFSLGLMLQPADWSGLSLAVGLSLVQSLDPQGDLGLRLKWPNDLWVMRQPLAIAPPSPAASDTTGVPNVTPSTMPSATLSWAKLAGILIETALPAGAAHDAGRYCVVGVGLNMAPPLAEGLSTAPLGLQALLSGITAPQALQRLAAPLLGALLAFERTGFAPLQAAFNARDALHLLPVTLSDGREGVAKGVDARGALLVDTEQGTQAISSAEVSVRPLAPVPVS